jgi:uncharacterized repeat protein (TIGR03803 family)
VYYGTVFKITPTGTLTTLYSFCSYAGCIDGANPSAGLTLATDGNFYGTNASGGLYGGGTLFKITPSGTLTILISFGGTDGAGPSAVLTLATDGNFYGTTVSEGVYGEGTVFETTPSGSWTTLHSFDGADGAAPGAGLVQASDGTFYGTTEAGGAGGFGVVFKITSGGVLAVMHSFDSTDGAAPYAGFVQAADGNFYGTTARGGLYHGGEGTVFEITPSGTLTTLYSFGYGRYGAAFPYAGLVQATNGDFYGTTFQGGTSNDGTVFSLSVGLGPFVKTLPASGKVGAKVIILGNSLAGTTSVTFNSTAATFTVASPTEIKTTVPTGATSGQVQVVTPKGTLGSNVPFRVK